MMLAGAGTEDGGWSCVIWWRRAVGAVADSEAPGESGFEDWGRGEFAFLAGHGLWLTESPGTPFSGAKAAG